MKYKVNRNRPKLSPQEIAKYRNFQGVFARYKTGKPFYRKPWFYSNVFVVVAAVSLLLIFLDKQEQVETAEINNSDSLANSAEASPAAFVNPPLPGINVNYSNYTIESSKGGELAYGKTKIIIPSGAIVDENNKPVQGEVEIRYREFHDVVDFFVSGIPMTYDSAGNTYHFESAGMMEILAYKDKKPVFIHPDKKIEIRMASNYPGSHYNLYYLDTAAKNWECRGKDEVLEDVQKTQPSPSMPAIKDTIASEGSIEQKPVMVQMRIECEKVKNEIAEISKTKPVEPKKLNKKKYTFNIEVDPKEFPELSVYKNVQFEVGDENKNFSSKMYKTTWESAALSEKEKGISYNLSLTKGSEKHSFVVYPVFEGKSYEDAMKTFKGKFEQYQVKLQERQEQEKKLQEEYEAKLKQMKEEAAARQKQYEEQMKRWKEEQASREKVAKTENEVLRVFYANRFGVYNCDSPQMYPKGETIAAEFSNKDGARINTSRVYLAEKNRNAMFTYYAGSGSAYERFKYNPSAKNMCWTITLDNKLAVYNYEDFAAIPKNPGQHNFRMKISEYEFKNLEELKDFLNI